MRPPCIDKINTRRGPWIAEEDTTIPPHGAENWGMVPRKSGPRKCAKNCRLRWRNYQNPDVMHEIFTPQEEELIIKIHATIGSRWSIIAQQLPGRTDNDVKNYWNTKLRKKLKEMGIDPVTHKPFSQVIRDYGNVGGSTARGGRIGPLNRDLRNAPLSRSETHNSARLQAFSNSNTHQIPSSPVTTGRTEIEAAHQNGHSLDLLAQLQAINMVTGNIVPLNSSSSSSTAASSSSSFTGSTAAQDFSWSEFINDDAILWMDQRPGVPEEFFRGGLVKAQSEMKSEDREGSDGGFEGLHQSGASSDSKGSSSSSSSSDRSFLEAILNQNKDMFMEFPELWEEPLYY